MKLLNDYITEKFRLRDDTKINKTKFTHKPKKPKELKTIIWDRINENPEYVDLSDIDTSLITNMSSLFSHTDIGTLNVTNWITSKVTNMANMFMKSTVHEIIGIEKFDTHNCETFWKMFSDCKNLEKLDLSSWKTYKIFTMSQMFSRCWQLTSVGDLSDWETVKVSSFAEMFRECFKLENIDISGWNFDNILFMSDMFRGCLELPDVNRNEIHVQQKTEINYVFTACKKMQDKNNVPKIIKDL